MSLLSIVDGLEKASSSLSALRDHCKDDKTSSTSFSCFADALEVLLQCVELGLSKTVTDSCERTHTNQVIVSLEKRISCLQQDYNHRKQMVCVLLEDAKKAKTDLSELVANFKVKRLEDGVQRTADLDESFVSSHPTQRKINRVRSRESMTEEDDSDCSDYTISSHLDEMADLLDPQLVKR